MSNYSNNDCIDKLVGHGELDQFINGTMLAKHFQKDVYDWLCQPYTKQYIDRVCATRDYDLSDLIRYEPNPDDISKPIVWVRLILMFELGRWANVGFALLVNEAAMFAPKASHCKSSKHTRV